VGGSCFDRRTTRVVVALVVVVLVVLSVWYRLAVVPDLTSIEYELWVAGDGNDLVIEVDHETDLVVVSNVPSGLPDMVVDGSAVYVRADAIVAGSDAVGWLSVPFGVIDTRFSALAPSRVESAIARDVKHCAAMSATAWSVVELLLAPSSGTDSEAEICERYAGSAGDEGETVLVSSDSRRPSGIGAVALAEAVSYLGYSDPDAVLDRLRVIDG
jgi:hypothetical protein